jgi:hypothetical protein
LALPGARGLFSQPANETPGFVQPIIKTDGTVGSISPFLIPQSVTDMNGKNVLLCPEDTDSVNHGDVAIDTKLDLDANHVAQNDRYAFVEEGITGGALSAGTRRLLGVQRGYGQFLGIDDAWAAHVIEAVGNYAEMFERDLGSSSVMKLARGPNNLWTHGGLMYALPIR